MIGNYMYTWGIYSYSRLNTLSYSSVILLNSLGIRHNVYIFRMIDIDNSHTVDSWIRNNTFGDNNNTLRDNLANKLKMSYMSIYNKLKDNDIIKLNSDLSNTLTDEYSRYGIRNFIVHIKHGTKTFDVVNTMFNKED